MSDSIVIRWEVDRVSELTHDGKESPIEYHFGIPWCVNLLRRKLYTDDSGTFSREKKLPRERIIFLTLLCFSAATRIVIASCGVANAHGNWC